MVFSVLKVLTYMYEEILSCPRQLHDLGARLKGSNMEALIRIFLKLISSTRTVINYCKKISFLWIDLKTILTHIWYTYAICFQILSVLWLSKHLLHVYMTDRFYTAPKSCRNTVFSILNIKFIKHVRKMQYIYGT